MNVWIYMHVGVLINKRRLTDAFKFYQPFEILFPMINAKNSEFHPAASYRLLLSQLVRSTGF